MHNIYTTQRIGKDTIFLIIVKKMLKSFEKNGVDWGLGRIIKIPRFLEWRGGGVVCLWHFNKMYFADDVL